MSDAMLVDLASERLGGRVIAANDDFFAPKENLVKDSDPVWEPGRFTDRGKWMDGWETRRRREPGHDWAIVALGVPGLIRRIVVDTAHFTGNFPESFSLETIDLPGDPDLVEVVRDPSRWNEAVKRTPLAGDTVIAVDTRDESPATHARFVIYPDGGVARLRLLGEPTPPQSLLSGSTVDLAALASGGRAVDCSDHHYSSPNRMLQPGDARGMWDGWETRRRRDGGHDWAIVRLAGPGRVAQVGVDTTHFKGNAPGWFDLEGAEAAPGRPLRKARWRPLLPKTPLEADSRHEYDTPADIGAVTHVRLNIHPDGGIARLRVRGIAEGLWTSAS